MEIAVPRGHRGVLPLERAHFGACVRVTRLLVLGVVLAAEGSREDIFVGEAGRVRVPRVALVGRVHLAVLKSFRARLRGHNTFAHRAPVDCRQLQTVRQFVDVVDRLARGSCALVMARTDRLQVLANMARSFGNLGLPLQFAEVWPDVDLNVFLGELLVPGEFLVTADLLLVPGEAVGARGGVVAP